MKGVFIAGALAGLMACHHGTAPKPQSRISFSFAEDRSPGVTRDMIHVRFSESGVIRTLDGSDFTNGPAQSNPYTAYFETQGSGELKSEIWLTSGTDTLAFGTLRLELREDWGWGVNITVADRNPIHDCVGGCFGSLSFKAAPPVPGDSLFLVWGGNSISNPVVY